MNNSGWYLVLMVINAGIGGFVAGVANGDIPIPPQYLWTMVIIVPMLNALSAFLPRIGKN